MGKREEGDMLAEVPFRCRNGLKDGLQLPKQ